MSFAVLLDDGFEVVTTRQNLTDFDPILGTAHDVDVGPFWRLAPDDVQDMPSDEVKFVESMWRGLLQHFSEIMTEATHLDATKSLTDFPLHFERKWLDFQIERTVDLSSEVANLLVLADDVPLSGLSTYTDGEDRSYNLFNLYGTDAIARIGMSLRSATGHRTQLRAEVTTVFDWDDRGVLSEVWMLWGYANTRQQFYSKHSGIWVAVSSSGRLGVLTVQSPGLFTAPLSSEYIRFDLAPVTLPITQGAQVTISMWYDGQMEGITDDQKAVMTVQVESAGTSVQWEQDLVFEVPLPSGTVPGTWWADSFVASAPPGEVAARVAEFGEGDYQLKLRPGNLTFLDPTVPPDVRYIPVLQPRVSDSRDILRAGLEFELERDPRGNWGYLRFDDEPPSTLWAESTALDLRLMHKMFGPLTGVMGELTDSDSYYLRTQIVGALYGLLSGPHLTQLAVAVGGLLGGPMALEAGRVKSFADLSGQPAIVVEEAGRDRIYPYLRGMIPTVVAGDTVSRFDPLVEMPIAHDWLTAPTQVADMVDDELQKFAALLVQIPSQYLMAEYDLLPRPVTATDIAAFSARFSRRLRQYLSQTVGVWVGIANTILQIVVGINDTLELEDTLLFSGRRDWGQSIITSLGVVISDAPSYAGEQIGDQLPTRQITTIAQELNDLVQLIGLVGNLDPPAINALASPARGDAYVVKGAGILFPGAIGVNTGDIVQFDGTNWVIVIPPSGSMVPPGTRVRLSTTTPLVFPYSGGNPGEMVRFDGTTNNGSIGEFTWNTLEYDKMTYPKDRTVLYAREALTGWEDPRYNDHDPVRSYGTGPTPPSNCPPPGLIYNSARIWVLDTRMDVIVTYDGVDVGPIDVTIYDQTVTMNHLDSHTFEEPDYWDECGRPGGLLDFSNPNMSGHAGGGKP